MNYYLCLQSFTESLLKPLLLYWSEVHMENNMVLSEQLSYRTLDLFANKKKKHGIEIDVICTNIYKKGLTNLSSIIGHKRKCLCKQQISNFLHHKQ